MTQYMKAMKAALGSSQSVITEDEYNTIFYKIPELHKLHSNFLETLKKQTVNWDCRIGDCFKGMASNLMLYGAFLHNYGRATDTVRKCCANNVRFNEIAMNIRCKHVSGQSISLEDLLHKPVARVQKNALVLHDLLKYTPPNHPDYRALNDALNMTQHFLDEFNTIQTKNMFPTTDRAQRRLVKNSFIVELVDGQRKLRHLFLFNDVIACAKYKVSSGRHEKYTFELKWFIPLGDIVILEENSIEPREHSPANIVALKSQACTVRDQILLEERVSEDKRIRLGSRSEKNRKKLAELEAQLVLASPNLVFRIKNKSNQRTQVFFLSSEFERTQWIESIRALQTNCAPPGPQAQVSMVELQAWITACRTFLKTNMGSYLLRTGRDESLLVGDLHVTIKDLQGLDAPADLYVCIEIDFYGHFFRKAKSKMVCGSRSPKWNETFVIDLEGSENLRLLIYRDGVLPTLFAKHTQKLSRSWLTKTFADRTILLNNCTFNIALKFIPSEVTLRRVPSAKPGALFGAKIQQVGKRQKRDIPFIVTSCIREVERRGMTEVGIYRVSGSASDLSRLKKSFETNSYEAEQLLKEVDIHSVTGILKLYLRELPEALFTDNLYPQLFEAYSSSQGNPLIRLKLLKEIYGKLPEQNQHCITYILEHLIRVHAHEPENKMSLHNLATVFGPTLLRPGGKTDNNKQRDLLTAGTVDVMAQAGILYCYLDDLRAKNT